MVNAAPADIAIASLLFGAVSERLRIRPLFEIYLKRWVTVDC